MNHNALLADQWEKRHYLVGGLDDATEICSPKRSVGDRKGIYSWVKYHAGFSPRFVQSVFDYLKLTKESELLDPYLGTGTSCIEARRRGLPSWGIELNGFAYYVARARLAWGFTRSELESELKALGLAEQKDSNNVVMSEQFKRWFAPDSTTPQRLTELGLRIKEIENRDLKDFLITSLTLTLRPFTNSKVGTNPAWVRIGKGRPGRKGDIFGRFLLQARKMFEDQLCIRGDGRTPVHIKRIDLRHAQFSHKFSAIVSSPPYLSRLDYVVAHRVENDFISNLGLQTSPDLIRNRLIGGVVLGQSPRTDLEPNREWGDLCIQKLEEVKNHQSKGSKIYYYPLMLRYFDDMFRCIEKFHGLLRKDGSLVLVAQSSYYKEVEIPLPQILLDMAKAGGFKQGKTIRRVVVKSHIGNKDPDQRKHVEQKWLFEDVIMARP